MIFIIYILCQYYFNLSYSKSVLWKHSIVVFTIFLFYFFKINNFTLLKPQWSLYYVAEISNVQLSSNPTNNERISYVHVRCNLWCAFCFETEDISHISFIFLLIPKSHNYLSINDHSILDIGCSEFPMNFNIFKVLKCNQWNGIKTILI